jgi:hypothetical protein
MRARRRIPLTEMLGVDSVTVGALPWCYKLPILTFKRSKKQRNLWQPRKVLLRFESMATCELWRSAIANELAAGVYVWYVFVYASHLRATARHASPGVNMCGSSCDSVQPRAPVQGSEAVCLALFV